MTLNVQLSTDKILTAVTTVSMNRWKRQDKALHLDIGSGTGALIELLRKAHPGLQSRACDYTDELMRLSNQPVDNVDLNADCTLPYPDQEFDLLTCTEVIEHLENYRRLIREAYRVTKPGGTIILTTPNVLNILSRVRYLTFGFWNLFGPLPLARGETYSTFGHITPVTYFYLAHALAESGFTDIRVDVDKYQRKGVALLPMFLAVVKGFGAMARRREVRKYRTIDAENAHFVGEMNTLKMLLGRTIIVSAQRSVER